MTSVVFENQVLYFQSKSILNVFWLMITHPDLQMKFVGILLVTFSVLFHFKIGCIAHIIGIFKSKANAMVHYFVFKSGKWSMTDVMVIAIFMAYIGFNGIIDSQLGNMSALKPELDVVTRQMGLHYSLGLFISRYALLGMLLSGMLARETSRASLDHAGGDPDLVRCREGHRPGLPARRQLLHHQAGRSRRVQQIVRSIETFWFTIVRLP